MMLVTIIALFGRKGVLEHDQTGIADFLFLAGKLRKRG